MKRGEVTAFLGLIFILLVSFTGSVMEATSIQLAKNYRRADAERAMECLFAEYQKELLEEYDVFALEGSYESGIYSKNMLDRRLEYYGVVNFKSSIERIQFLTDDGAQAFREQVISYMKQKYGLDYIEESIGLTDNWTDQYEQGQDFEKEESNNQANLNHLLSENESQLPEEDNPINCVDNLKKTPILNLVMPKEKTVSEKKIILSEVPSHRELNVGCGDFSDEQSEQGTAEKLLFGEYVLEHFASVIDEKEKILDYEVEYIISGEATDRENLRKVVNKLMILRFVPNYTYLQTSAQKKAEAEALALTLCSVLAVPAITEATAQGILLAWAFGESLVDLKTLLKGNRVPFIKDDNSWQLSLSGLLKLEDGNAINDGADSEEGLGYEEYLRILLFLEDNEEVAMRTLDLIELNLKKIRGLDFLKVDSCISKLEMKMKCTFRRDISYTFPVYFSYQ